MRFRLDEARADAEARIAHGDFRFIALGASPHYPGVPGVQLLLCDLGWRLLKGTSDAESVEHRQLNDRLRQYAVAYNSHIVSVYLKIFGSGG